MSENETLLKEARLGSAHHGAYHWLILRVTALALIPLSVWFVVTLITLTRAGHQQVSEFFLSPLHAILMALMVVFSFYHAALGLQEVIEDYVHGKFKKIISLLVINFSLLLVGGVTLLAVIKMHSSG
jgi:succinate dehydrogenase / fumarate reductase membrane anchor subunit